MLYEGRFNETNDIYSFLQTESLPLVIRLNEKTFYRVFGG